MTFVSFLLLQEANFRDSGCRSINWRVLISAELSEDNENPCRSIVLGNVINETKWMDTDRICCT